MRGTSRKDSPNLEDYMPAKPAELQMLKGKKITGRGASTPRGGGTGAQDKREQALARKRQLLERHRTAK
jgi:hypothetical protein